MKSVILIPFVAATICFLAACAGTAPPVGEHDVYHTAEKAVQRPCPVKKPARPAKLARPLPSDPGALAELLIAKLLEWDGPGGYGDQAGAALDTCLKAPQSPVEPH